MILPVQDLEHVLVHMRCWEKLSGKRIFLTGASGFVGTWLSESFEWANRKLSLEASLTKMPRDAFPDGCFDFGIHAAKIDSFADDCQLTGRILNFAAESKVVRFLYTSSGAVYGSDSEYAQAKRLDETLCIQAARQHGFCAVIARLFTFLGPGLPLNLNFAVGNFIRDVMAGGPVVIESDGTAERSYLYAADLAIWLWTLLLEGDSCKPYDVGSPDALSIYDLAAAVVANTNPGTPIVVRGQTGYRSYVPLGELSMRPLISLDEGIRRMYAWNRLSAERNQGCNSH